MNVSLTETLQGSAVFGGAAAMLGGRASATYTLRTVRPGGRLVQCNRVIHDLSSLQVDAAEGSGSGSAKAILGISGDGQYSVSVTPDFLLTTRSTSTAQQMILDTRGCRPESQSGASHEGRGSMAVSVDVQGDGRIDPERPDRLTGRTEEKEGNTTRTLTWDLQRR